MWVLHPRNIDDNVGVLKRKPGSIRRRGEEDAVRSPLPVYRIPTYRGRNLVSCPDAAGTKLGITRVEIIDAIPGRLLLN